MSKYFGNGSQLTHVPVYPWGTDPSRTNPAIGQPSPVRQTITVGIILKNNGTGVMGLMSGSISPATAEITCTQANVVPGQHSILVGALEFRPAVDFAVGADDTECATNLAAAIALSGRVYGYTATSNLGVVTISTLNGHSNDHRVEVVEWGAASAFALSATTRPGYMDQGSPAPSAPQIA